MPLENFEQEDLNLELVFIFNFGIENLNYISHLGIFLWGFVLCIKKSIPVLNKMRPNMLFFFRQTVLFFAKCNTLHKESHISC